MVRRNNNEEELEAWLAGHLPEPERRALEASLDAPDESPDTPPALAGLEYHQDRPADLAALIEILKTRPPETASNTAPQPGAWRDLLAPDPDPAFLGRLGSYQVVRAVADQGMGVVLEACDPELSRTVALKVLSPDLATNRTACKRFLREARAAAKLEHDNILPVYAVHETAGVPYFAMRFASGGSLQHRLDRGENFTPAELKTIATGIANALAAAHANGIVHRDIKPANVLFGDDDPTQLWVCDFGIARSTEDPSLTYPGTVAGTPLYMSPEQAEGKPVDARSDLFSLGAVLYHLAAGQPPFPGKTTAAVLNNLATAGPDLTRLGDTPTWFANLVSNLLAADPDQRPPDAPAVVHAIESENAPPPRRRHRKLKTTTITTVAALALATLAALQFPATKDTINAHRASDLTTAFSISGHLGVHPTLADAVATALDGDTIEIHSNQPVTIANLRIPSGKKLTIKPATSTRRATLATPRPGALGLSAADHLTLVDIDFQLQSTSGMAPMLHFAAGADLHRCHFHSETSSIHGPFFSNPCAIQLDGGPLRIHDTTFAPSIAVPIRVRNGSPEIHLADTTATASYVIHAPNNAGVESLSITTTDCDFAATNFYRQDIPRPVTVTADISRTRFHMATRTVWAAADDPQQSLARFTWSGTANDFPLGGAEARFEPGPAATVRAAVLTLTPQPPRITIDATGREFTDLAAAIAAAPAGATLLLAGELECNSPVNSPPGLPLNLRAAPGASPTISSRNPDAPVLTLNGPATLSGIRFHRFPAAKHAPPIVTIKPQGEPCLVEDCTFIATASGLGTKKHRALGISNAATATIRRCLFHTPGGHALLLGRGTPELHIEDTTIIATSAIEHHNPGETTVPTITIARSTIVAGTAITGGPAPPARIDLTASILQLREPAPPHIAWNPAPDVITGTPFRIATYPPYLLTADTLQESLDPTLTGPAIDAFKNRPPPPE